MTRLPRRVDRRADGSMPILLPGFLVAMLAVVGAVVVVGRTGSDLADIGAVALLLITTGVMMVAIARRLDAQRSDVGLGDAEDRP